MKLNIEKIKPEVGKIGGIGATRCVQFKKITFLINFWQTISGSSEKYDNLIPLPADVWSCGYFLKMLFSPYRPRLSTMEKIRHHVEEVSRQSFFVGWMKVDPSVVNQIENP